MSKRTFRSQAIYPGECSEQRIEGIVGSPRRARRQLSRHVKFRRNVSNHRKLEFPLFVYSRQFCGSDAHRCMRGSSATLDIFPSWKELKPRNVQARNYLGFFQAIQSSSNSCLPEATPSFSRTRYQLGDRKPFELLMTLATIFISHWHSGSGLNSLATSFQIYKVSWTITCRRWIIFARVQKGRAYGTTTIVAVKCIVSCTSYLRHSKFESSLHFHFNLLPYHLNINYFITMKFTILLGMLDTLSEEREQQIFSVVGILII